MDRPLRVLHAADFHLDTPFGDADFGSPVQRRQELRQCALAALEQGADCDLILLAGDVFDHARVYPETIEALQTVLENLDRPVFVAPGNHDAYNPSSPWLTQTWPGNVHIFKTPQIQAVDLPRLDCTVYGAAFTDAGSAGLLEGFSVRDPARLNLMVLHGDAANPGSAYNPVTPAQIEASGLDYLALGHIHAPSGLLRAGGAFYAWPGCLLGRDYGEAGQKGVYRLEVSKGDCRAVLLPTAGPRWMEAAVPVRGDAAGALRDALVDARPGDHWRLTLTGVCPEPVGLPTAQALGLSSLTILDQTRREADLWAGAGSDNLRGAFLARLQQAYASSEDPERREVCRLAAQYGLAALDGREEPC